MIEMMSREVEFVTLHTTTERDASLRYHDTYKFFHRVSREKCRCTENNNKNGSQNS